MRRKKSKDKQILRKCTGCGNIKERTNLIRIMKTSDTCEVIIMPDSRHFGRSAYLCYNRDCLNNAIKKKRFQRALNKDVTGAALEYLEKMISE